MMDGLHLSPSLELNQNIKTISDATWEFINTELMGYAKDNKIENMLKSDDPKLKDFGRMREATIGHPDASEISQTKIFARDIMKKHN